MKRHSLILISGAVAALVAGCGKPDDATPPAPTTSVAPPPVAAVQPAPEPAVDPQSAIAPDDAAITSRVREALLADADVKDQKIDVSASEGVVQLSGFVDTGAQTSRAAAVASGVDGVRSVDNRLELKAGSTAAAAPGAQPGQKLAVNDAAITGQIKEALLADPYMNNFDVAVVTRNGEVQLSGFVASQDQADDVVALAHKMEGVKNVVSTLSVGNAESPR